MCKAEEKIVTLKVQSHLKQAGTPHLISPTDSTNALSKSPHLRRTEEEPGVSRAKLGPGLSRWFSKCPWSAHVNSSQVAQGSLQLTFRVGELP